MEYVIFDVRALPDVYGEPVIVEIGAVKLNENMEEIGSFQKFRKYSRTIEAHKERLYGISTKETAVASPFNEVIKQFKEWGYGPEATMNEQCYGNPDRLKMVCRGLTQRNWLEDELHGRGRYSRWATGDKTLLMVDPFEKLKELNLNAKQVNAGKPALRCVDVARELSKVFIERGGKSKREAVQK